MLLFEFVYCDRKLLAEESTVSNSEEGGSGIQNVHYCDGMKQLEVQVAELTSQIQLLKFGTRFSHIAENNDLVSIK